MATAQNIKNRLPITIAIMLAMFMQSLDITISNVALPHMQGSVSAGSDQITWALTSYIVAMAVMTPLSSWLADKIGRKHTLCVSLALFTVASMFCGIASTLPEMVAYRFLQGAAGAALVPLSQAELLDINPPEKHGQAIALWSGAGVVAPALGPMVGGYLTDNLSWRWCFYINLPIGIIALLGLWIFMSGDKPATARKLDFMGYAALAVFVTALQLMLDRGPTLDWFSSTEIWIEATTAAMSAWVFVAHLLTTKEAPFFDPSLLTDRNFAPCTAFTFVITMVMFAILALIPPLTQTLMGYSVLGAGQVMAPRGMVAFVMMFFLPLLMKRFDLRLLLLVGLAATGAATWQMTKYDLNMSGGPIIVAGIVQGIGTGLVFVPLNVLAFATLPAHMRAEASSLFTLVRSLGGSVGIALMQGQVVIASQTMHASLAARIDLSDPVITQGLPAALDPRTAAGAMGLNAEITRQAMMVAYLDSFRIMTIMLAIMAPLCLVLRKPRGMPPPEEAAAALAE